jgi:hypothetical protein
MRAHDRYPDRLEGSGEPFLLTCWRTPPGSTVRRALSLTGITATLTVRRVGGLTDGEVVLSARSATVSALIANTFEYVPTATERRLIERGSYEVFWMLTRAGRPLPYGPIDQSVVESPYGVAAISGGALIFHIPSNSGLLAVI